MPCVCGKTITPTQHNPANLKSYTPSSSLMNERKETAACGQLSIEDWWRVLDLSHEHSHSHGRLRCKSKFSSSPAREAVLRALCGHPELQAPCPRVLPRRCSGSLFGHTSSFCSLQALRVVQQLSSVPQLLEDLECTRDTSALTSIHERAQGISPEHLLSLVP